LLCIEKKGAMKFADALHAPLFTVDDNSNVTKAVISSDILTLDSFNVNVAINTTNLMDSHDDVHIPNIWNKSLKEQKLLYLLQEHNMTFQSIISDNVKALAKTMTWKELGYNYEGTTQVLLFNAKIDKERNTYMAEQYAKDRVKNHSVGMRYVQLDLAMNSSISMDKEEKKIWDKYINQIANREQAEEKGYFWAVTEAKLVEGSAVPLGSNYATPTISVGKIEPEQSTQSHEPEQSTHVKTGYEIFK
jgi:hypothetical protein